MHKTYIHIDEIGFIACTQRNSCRSLRDTKFVRNYPLLKAPNVSVCIAVPKEDCVVYYSVKDNALDGESFTNFIETLLKKDNKFCYLDLNNAEETFYQTKKKS